VLEFYPPQGEAEWLRSCVWSQPFRPRFFETDALGHVSNVFYTAYIEMGRLSFFNSLNDPDRESEYVFGFVHNAAEIAMRFLRPCFYDEALQIHIKIAKLGTSSAILEHAITSEGGADIRTLARVAIVRMKDGAATPWSAAQRTILERLTPKIR